MKQKYLLRGIGIGIIIGALIMFAAVQTTENNSEKSNSDVKATQTNASYSDAETEENHSEETQEQTVEVQINTDTESDTSSEDAESTEDVSVNTPVTIEVTSGMHSEAVAALLEENGIISDSGDFDNWLVANDYATKIRVNTYTFTKGMTYEEIADILVNTPQE